MNIGRWWNANEEIDLIALDENNAILIECKWTSKKIGTDILEDLEHKAQLVKPELKDRSIRYALCSRSGFTDQLIQDANLRQDLMLFDLETIISS